MATLRNVAIFALLTVSLVAGFISFGPDLLRDIGLRNSTMVPNLTVRIEKAQCKGFAYVLRSCTITFNDTLASRQGGATQPSRSLSYLIVGSPGERRVMLQRAADRPGSVTSDLGMEYLTNRILTFVGLTLLFIFILTSIAFYIVRTFATRNEDGAAENSIDQAMARAVQKSATSPAWQQPTGLPRAAQPATRSRFGQRAPAR